LLSVKTRTFPVFLPLHGTFLDFPESIKTRQDLTASSGGRQCKVKSSKVNMYLYSASSQSTSNAPPLPVCQCWSL